jgi:hypothetical protein
MLVNCNQLFYFITVPDETYVSSILLTESKDKFDIFKGRISKTFALLKSDTAKYSSSMLHCVNQMEGQLCQIQQQESKIYMTYRSLEWKLKLVQRLHAEEIERLGVIMSADRVALLDEKAKIERMLPASEFLALQKEFSNAKKEIEELKTLKSELQSWCVNLNEKNENFHLQIQAQNKTCQQLYSEKQLLRSVMQNNGTVLAELMQEYECLILSLGQLVSRDSYGKLRSEIVVLEAEKSSLQIHV